MTEEQHNSWITKLPQNYNEYQASMQEWNSDFGLDKDRKKDYWQGF